MRKAFAMPLLLGGVLYSSMFAAAPAWAATCTTNLNLGTCNSGTCNVNGVNSTCDGGHCGVNLSYCGQGCNATVNWGRCGSPPPPPPPGACETLDLWYAEDGTATGTLDGHVLLFDADGLPLEGSLECRIYVNGNQAYSSTATGSGALVVAQPVSFPALMGDSVTTCAYVATVHGSSFACS